MADPSPAGKTNDLVVSTNGTDPRQAAPRYCAFCGQETLDSARAPERFGEVFCSEDHAEEFAKGVRGARVAAAATAAEVPAAAGREPQPHATAPAKPSDWKTSLKMAACCGVPMLGLVVLAGGGGALLGAAGAVAPLLLALACPLGMFFMMWRMGKMGQHEKGKRDDDGK
ncbi:MAG: DUF2933 domain-containing protein [Candidatus Rokubacteria bacterium]|nr:DUF2933 domain-containing protein [Candidatus Rokubacteria bacterium]